MALPPDARQVSNLLDSGRVIFGALLLNIRSLTIRVFGNYSAPCRVSGALNQQQQSFIQQQLLSGHILIESMKETHEESDKEPVIGNIVFVKKFDWEFVELDLPTLLRRLKQYFSRKRLQ